LIDTAFINVDTNISIGIMPGSMKAIAFLKDVELALPYHQIICCIIILLSSVDNVKVKWGIVAEADELSKEKDSSPHSQPVSAV